MSPTLDDLRGALHEQADGTAYPDVDALVAGAGRRVAATRRRRLTALSATTAVVLAIGGFVATTGSADKAVPPPQPASPGPYSVNAGGGGFPEYSGGMKRVRVFDAPMGEQTKGSLTIPTTPGRLLALRMTCTPTETPHATELSNRMVATFTGPAPSGAGCGITRGLGFEPMGTATGTTTTVLADVRVYRVPESDPPDFYKDAKVHVAFYEGVPWQDYPFPPRPADVAVNRGGAWVNEPGTIRQLGPRTAEAANKPVTFVQPYEPDIQLSLSVVGPGRIRMLVDGVDVSDRFSHFNLDKTMSYWDYKQIDSLHPLYPLTLPVGGHAARPEPKRGTPVTVTILPQDFVGPDWRVKVMHVTTGG